MADESCGCSGGGILWFLAGLGIGAAVGVFYAPKAGHETRESILNAAEEGRELVQERARKYKEQAQEWADRGKDVISQQKDNIRSAFEAGRQAYRDATQEAPSEPGTPTYNLNIFQVCMYAEPSAEWFRIPHGRAIMNQTALLTAFVGVTSVAVVLQMLILAGMYQATRKTSQRVEELSTKVHEQVLPLVARVRGIVEESAPAIQTMVTNLTETSTLVREQAGKINETVTEVVEIVRTQAGQADILATRTMQRVDITAAAWQHAALSPARRLSALIEGVSAGVGQFVGRRDASRNKAVPTDEMFI